MKREKKKKKEQRKEMQFRFGAHFNGVKNFYKCIYVVHTYNFYWNTMDNKIFFNNSSDNKKFSIWKEEYL